MATAERTRLIRLSAGALLLAQDRTEKLVAEAAKPHMREAASAVEAKRGDRRDSLRTLLTVGAAMAPAIASALDSGKRAARAAGIRRLDAELAAAGRGAAQAQSLMALRYIGRTEIDSVESRIAADSLVAQWRGMAQAALSIFGRKTSPGAAVAKAERLFAPRIRRTAASESARAFNDEHRARLEDAVRSGEVDPRGLFREWSAMVEACPRCRPLDGVQVAFDESFPGGEVPGGVHPHCACTEVLVERAVARAA